jgi:hypothetical protein
MAYISQQGIHYLQFAKTCLMEWREYIFAKSSQANVAMNADSYPDLHRGSRWHLLIVSRILLTRTSRKTKIRLTLAAQFFKNGSTTEPQSFNSSATNTTVFIHSVLCCFSEDDEAFGSTVFSCGIRHSPLKLEPTFESNSLSILLAS